MTKASQFADLADALEAAAVTDRELDLDVDTIALRRTARVPSGDGLRVWSSGGPTRVYPTVTNQPWLWFGDLAGGIDALQIEDVYFIPPAGCVPGQWALRCDKVARARYVNVRVSGNSGAWGPLAAGGLWLNGYDDSAVLGCKLYAHHKGLLVNGMKDQSWGADLTVDSATKLQNHRLPDRSDYRPGGTSVPVPVGIHLAGGQGGDYIDANVIYCGLGILVDTAMTGAGVINREVFLRDGCIVDSCVEDGIRVMPRSCGTLHLTGAWSSSNGLGGGAGCGLRVEADNPELKVFGMLHAFNNREDGVAANGGYWALVGLLAETNGRYGLHVPNLGAKGAVHALWAREKPNGKGPTSIAAGSTFKVGTLY